MGMQLGPGFLRRPPRGWLPARVSAVAHRAYDHPQTAAAPESGQGEIDLSCRLNARWRVELPGREPYEFDEAGRTAPTWVLTAGLLGGGNRWYKVRVAPSYGLMDEVAFPCSVDPGDPQRIWIDWDAAYDAHTEAWGRHARVEREVARRENRWEYAVERVTKPFAGRITDEERELADRAIEERERVAAEQVERSREEEKRWMAEHGWVSDADGVAETKRAAEELKRIHATGRKAKATVLERRETGRRIGAVAVVELLFDVDDGGLTRRVRYEHLFGPRGAKRYTPGRTVTVWIDPQDPNAICPGR